MLKGEAKAAYMREYMRRKRAGKQPDPKDQAAAEPQQNGRVQELEAEIARLSAGADKAENARLKARIAELEAQVRDLDLRFVGMGGIPKTLEEMDRRKRLLDEQRKQEREAKKREKAAAAVAEAAETVGPDAAPAALHEVLSAKVAQLTEEVERLTKLRERDRTEIRNLKQQVRVLGSAKGFGDPLPPQVAKLIPHLGNENEHERLAALNKISSALKANGQNFSDLASRAKA